jgi:hypothetical protein
MIEKNEKLVNEKERACQSINDRVYKKGKVGKKKNTCDFLEKGATKKIESRPPKRTIL